MSGQQNAMSLNEVRLDPLVTALRGLATALRGDRSSAEAGLPLWRYLLAFRPPQFVRDEIAARGRDWAVLFVEDAVGVLNLDFYPVTVTEMPVLGGVPATATTLLQTVRRDINVAVDPSYCTFSPFDDVERTRWLSATPVGSVVHIDMKLTAGPASINLEDGSVVCGEAAADHWIFSTLRAPGDFDHPVSGNRWFGYSAAGGGAATFFTCGLDRPTGDIDSAAAAGVFAGTASTWRSFQEGLVRLVTDNGGAARIGTPHSDRYDWEQMRDLLR